MDDLVGDFVAETRESLEALDSELIRFEQNPEDPGILGNVFRLIHTVKGTCGFLGLVRLQNIAHAAENVLSAFRDGEAQVSAGAVSAILDALDLIRAIIEAINRTGVEPQGDDAALISRLERANAPQAAPTPPVRPSAPAETQPRPAKTTLSKNLIERLGGDATLDAAIEMALENLRSQAAFLAAFDEVDPDILSAVVRDHLAGLARNTPQHTSFVQALTQLTSTAIPKSAIADLLQVVCESLVALEIEQETVLELFNLVGAPKDEAAPVANKAPEVRRNTAAEARPAPKTLASDAADDAPPAMESEAAPQTIRVQVDALENLMTVVSELVLIRNQLVQTLRSQPESAFAAPLNRLNQVTSELQEGVMTTRMQPISGAWSKLPRLVRDLSRDLGKSIDLVQQGQETELDRQVLELIRDPLTHMIRNAADHGLEPPADRRAAGKSETGTIKLSARHEGGAIVIEVSDDGRGLSLTKLRQKIVASGLVPEAQAAAMSDADLRQVIFRPGFSTASQVTAVSGRGVGMDVVRTNIERIGGTIELQSVEGQGTNFIIRIPLTLAIVSALIVECCGIRFAMPQTSVIELVSANEASSRTIEHVHGAPVLRLRDRLLPLVSLQALLKLPVEDVNRTEACIVVAKVGGFTFGVIVDRVFDTEEIVVKPASSILRDIKLYSGTTILGDGAVIMILDFKGISTESGAAQLADRPDMKIAAEDSKGILTNLLVFKTADGINKAAPLDDVARIEELDPGQIESVDGRTVIQYRGKLMPIVDSAGRPAALQDDKVRPLLVFNKGAHSLGLLVETIVDIVEVVAETDLVSNRQGSLGSLTVAGCATELIDVDYFWRCVSAKTQPKHPPASEVKIMTSAQSNKPGRVLLVDDTAFAGIIIAPLLQRAGHAVTIVTSPDQILKAHKEGKEFDLIMLDMSLETDGSRSLATAFTQAPKWHSTPVMEMPNERAGRTSTATFNGQMLLLDIDDRLNTRKNAA